jgi:hypothetical protein
MYENDIKNIKWFILGAAISSNIRFWTGNGNTNKKFVANLSVDGKTVQLKRESYGGEYNA